MNFISHLIGEYYKHFDHVPYKRYKKEQIKTVVELSYADCHQDAMMIILMNASLALVAVSHSHPFRQITL